MKKIVLIFLIFVSWIGKSAGEINQDKLARILNCIVKYENLHDAGDYYSGKSVEVYSMECKVEQDGSKFKAIRLLIVMPSEAEDGTKIVDFYEFADQEDGFKNCIPEEFSYLGGVGIIKKNGNLDSFESGGGSDDQLATWNLAIDMLKLKPVRFLIDREIKVTVHPVKKGK